MRGIGLVELLSTVPDWVVVLAALLTQLGDAWFVFLVLVSLYWLGDDRLAVNPRRVGATLLGIGFAALAITAGLKIAFTLPRPPGAAVAMAPSWLPDLLASAYVNAATGTGFGFPSGHAIASTMLYGGLAMFLDVGDRRTRWLVAGVIITTVGLTRLVLGVHFLIDVLAGVIVGLAALSVFQRIARSGFRPRPDRVFFASAVGGFVVLVASLIAGHGGEAIYSAIGTGGAFGGYLVWRVRGTETEPVGVAGTLLGGVIVGGLFLGAYSISIIGLPYVFGIVPDTTPYQLLAVLPLSILAGALTVAWPTLVGRMRSRAVTEPSGDY